MTLVNIPGIAYVLCCDNRSNQPPLQNVLQTEEQHFVKFSTSTFEIGIDDGRIRWILLVMRYLRTIHNTNSC